IGGPTEIFGEAGFLPVYELVERVDNCLFSARTIWAGQVEEDGHFEHPALAQPGRQFICEATDLKPIHSSSYDCILASHCLEHVASPLRALEEWRRVLKTDGLLLLILPHKDGTFDWRRPSTLLSHMIEDYQNHIGEDDLTHLPEILALHDLDKDRAAGSFENFRRRCLENYYNRAMHHHVFDGETALTMVDYAKYQVVRIEFRKPYHIILVARRSDGTPDNSEFLGAKAAYRSRSPFPSDLKGSQEHRRQPVALPFDQ